MSSLSTLSLAQIISPSSLQSISLLRGSINQRKHGSICLCRATLTDPSITEDLEPYFTVLRVDFLVLQFIVLYSEQIPKKTANHVVKIPFEK